MHDAGQKSLSAWWCCRHAACAPVHAAVSAQHTPLTTQCGYRSMCLKDLIFRKILICKKSMCVLPSTARPGRHSLYWLKMSALLVLSASLMAFSSATSAFSLLSHSAPAGPPASASMSSSSELACTDIGDQAASQQSGHHCENQHRSARHTEWHQTNPQ